MSTVRASTRRRAVKLLFLSDTQLGAGKNLAEDRLADQEAVLGRIAEIADERSVDVVVHCGDVFEHRHPDEDARMVVKRWAITKVVRPFMSCANAS